MASTDLPFTLEERDLFGFGGQFAPEHHVEAPQHLAELDFERPLPRHINRLFRSCTTFLVLAGLLPLCIISLTLTTARG